jgi:hypothetical protein
MTMIKFIKSLFFPTIYEPVPRPTEEEMKQKAREFVDLEPGSWVNFPMNYDYSSMRIVRFYEEIYRKEKHKPIPYYRDGYTFAHKKYWGT